ncbi:MAG TPA: ABC transporter permease [Chloroflexia bacterium]|nr:ABC transporter permease [Chloroflexia bacterium]
MATVIKSRKQQQVLSPVDETVRPWDGLATGVFTLWLKHMRKFRGSTMEIGGTLIAPALWLLFFGVCMDSMVKEVQKLDIGIGYKAFIVPGIMFLTSLSAAVLGGTTLLMERINGVIKEYLVAPIPRISVLLGTLASSLTKAILQSLVVVAVGTLLDPTLLLDPVRVLVSLFVVVCFSLGFIGLATAFACTAKTMESYHSLIMVMNLPVLFLSNALYPISQMPNLIKWLSFMNPTTYAVDAVRTLLYGAKPEIGLWIDLPVLVAFMIAGTLYGYKYFQRTVSNVVA